MAVKIKSLKSLSDTFTEKQYVFKDLELDIKIDNIDTPGFTAYVPGKDIKVSKDGRAIVNSLLNLFNTRPGQRFLFPEYGVRLHKHIFEPATESNAQLVGDAILAAIESFEPRVNVRYINIKVYEDENAYEFDVYYDVPLLNLSSNTSFFLESQKRTFAVRSSGERN